MITTDDAGEPFATHLPILLDAERGPLGTLRGHVARANPHWRYLAAGRPTLTVFAGAHAYVSPSWYATHPSVPTWNYVAVHARGAPRRLEEPERVRELLVRTAALFEAGAAEPWRLDAVPAEWAARMQRAIVAFELPIERLEGKAKLSQNKSAADRAGVVAGLRESGDAAAAALAAHMEALA
jgi:transcriptional regulator